MLFALLEYWSFLESCWMSQTSSVRFRSLLVLLLSLGLEKTEKDKPKEENGKKENSAAKEESKKSSRYDRVGLCPHSDAKNSHCGLFYRQPAKSSTFFPKLK